MGGLGRHRTDRSVISGRVPRCQAGGSGRRPAIRSGGALGAPGPVISSDARPGVRSQDRAAARDRGPGDLRRGPGHRRRALLRPVARRAVGLHPRRARRRRRSAPAADRGLARGCSRGHRGRRGPGAGRRLRPLVCHPRPGDRPQPDPACRALRPGAQGRCRLARRSRIEHGPLGAGSLAEGGDVAVAGAARGARRERCSRVARTAGHARERRAPLPAQRAAGRGRRHAERHADLQDPGAADPRPAPARQLERRLHPRVADRPARGQRARARLAARREGERGRWPAAGRHRSGAAGGVRGAGWRGRHESGSTTAATRCSPTSCRSRARGGSSSPRSTAPRSKRVCAPAPGACRERRCCSSVSARSASSPGWSGARRARRSSSTNTAGCSRTSPTASCSRIPRGGCWRPTRD